MRCILVYMSMCVLTISVYVEIDDVRGEFLTQVSMVLWYIEVL